jgi:hypothetical protein
MPDCRRRIVLERTPLDREPILGVVAHIRGENPGSARYDSTMKPVERNSAQNLIVVCPTCHTKIDTQPNTYPAEVLYDIKAKHESWVSRNTIKEVINVGFPELQQIIQYLASTKSASPSPLTLITPREKIRKNNLSSTVENLIKMGMTQTRQVSDYLNAITDVEYGNRLKHIFISEYVKLRNQEGLFGDDLFNCLMSFAANGATNFVERAAGLAVLVYLFEKCEVFEK